MQKRKATAISGFFVKKITSIGIQIHLLQILISKQKDISQYYYANLDLKKHKWIHLDFPTERAH
jgi:hypothetical protein